MIFIAACHNPSAETSDTSADHMWTTCGYVCEKPLDMATPAWVFMA